MIIQASFNLMEKKKLKISISSTLFIDSLNCEQQNKTDLRKQKKNFLPTIFPVIFCISFSILKASDEKKN